MRLDSSILISLLLLCQCSFFNADKTNEPKKIDITCMSNDCQINNRSVIIVLNKKDCQRCTEKVERIGEIISEKISKKRIVFILKNYNDHTVIAYKRSLRSISDQILVDQKDVTMHSNINGMSHFVVFDKSQSKYKTFLPDQFHEMSILVND